jgi:hypothetical protein
VTATVSFKTNILTRGKTKEISAVKLKRRPFLTLSAFVVGKEKFEKWSSPCNSEKKKNYFFSIVLCIFLSHTTFFTASLFHHGKLISLFSHSQPTPFISALPSPSSSSAQTAAMPLNCIACFLL